MSNDKLGIAHYAAMTVALAAGAVTAKTVDYSIDAYQNNNPAVTVTQGQDMPKLSRFAIFKKETIEQQR